MLDDLNSEYEALLQFMYMVPIGLVQFSQTGEIAMINPAAVKLMMMLDSSGQCINLYTALEMVSPELRNLVASYSKSDGIICDAVRSQVCAGVPGKRDPQVLEVTIMKLDANRLVAVLSDVSHSVKREQHLRQADAWFNAIVTGATDYALLPLGKDGTVSYWNAGIGRLTGFAASDIVGKSYSALYPSNSISAERAVDYLQESDESGWSLHESWCVKSDGAQFWSSNIIVPLDPLSDVPGQTAPELGVQRGYALIIRDISERRATTAELLRVTMSDHLTGIFNRRAFFDAAELELSRWRRFPRPLSLLAIDVDLFKQVNDTHGHSAGDTVLRQIAETMSRTARATDIVARVGGEEFAVLLPSTVVDAALEIAERLRLSVASHHVEVDGKRISITISIGVSTMASGISGIDELLKRADIALYEAKRRGRNQIVLDTT